MKQTSDVDDNGLCIMRRLADHDDEEETVNTSGIAFGRAGTKGKGKG